MLTQKVIIPWFDSSRFASQIIRCQKLHSKFYFIHDSKQESPADAVKPTRRKSMQKLLQFNVFRFISPNSISPNFKV